MDNVILRARGLYREFKKEKERIPVVKGVSLDLAAGDCVAIMGSSGAGKSTLLHMLGTLDRPTSGELAFAPLFSDVWKLSDEALSDFRNRNIGFVFQFHYLLPEFTALENVMMPALISGMARPEAETRARGLLEFVGLGSRLEHKPGELSGGEQQRVAIARAVILKPRILLGDEMTGNLDSENSKKVIDLLLDLNRQFGIAILIVTHDPEVAARMKRVITMKDGKITSS